MTRIDHMLVRWRFQLQAGFDAVVWMLAVPVAGVLRLDFQLSGILLGDLLLVGALAATAQVVLGRLFGLYIHRWRYATLEEVIASTKSTLAAGALVSVIDVALLDRLIPLGAALMATVLSLVMMLGGRSFWRVMRERRLIPTADRAEPVIIVGAGEGGTQLVRSMLNSPTSPYLPVAIIDDNPDLRNLRVKHVPVLGGRGSLTEVAERMGCSTVVLAIPSADGEIVREYVSMADEAGLRTLVLPPVGELLGGSVGVLDVRPLTEADLLGRRELNTDIEAVAGYLTGRRVLVTGAGGSIGSELVRQIHRFAPERVIMLDRDESALQAVQVSIEGRGLLDDDALVVACIRDAERIDEVFREHRPHVVFHAAALKHLPLLELHPEEGFKTNVLGTQNLLDAAGRNGVSTFVNISTDKAADPSSTLGRTKRLAERLTAHAGEVFDGDYLSVRFGNVLGSRGSVLPLFRSQLERGGPLTVTHPEVTRFFMTIEEACQLVIQAGAIGHCGEVMVLDMGEPVKILELARRLVAEARRPVQIEFTGLRPGEKLHEVLFAPEEEPMPSAHPLIAVVSVEPLDPSDIATTKEVDLRARRARLDGGVVFDKAG